ncbi:MAG: Cysteine desulfurase, SufD subfamily [Candidatus Curtissbacteria bacterium GW2011_GWA1_40_16]|uniref:Cysteine desulfurase n=1 Tax=Candidatus Curtissbacteria bacterium GW2011_GWA1_40_16 TaxID=1618405 RepID=A0A0G0RED6_9BACT|nr:MAG: Cysteine desulfurase, SufD subfamily [Candidatus Curtissbacteria bacterium GW2011_GWA1_40_16]
MKTSPVDFKKLRADFPILSRKVNGRSLVYLDSAATSQKPKQVIESISNYYKNNNANVHRGIHTLSVEATEMYEAARRKVADFVGVNDAAEIVFVRNATEALNLIAYSWGRLNISKGDEIVVTVAEHHSNFVPWQQLAIENGAILKIVPILDDGSLDEEAFKKAITKKTKLVSFFHVSNVLGTINDVRRLSTIVHRQSSKAIVVIDGAQAVPHMPVDIGKIGCDFYVFTGHKILGPTGIGVLWGKRELLEVMPPFMFGGEMISKVSLNKSTWNELPWKFEAGTPDIAGAVGLGAAVDCLNKIGMENVRKHEIELVDYAIKRLSKVDDVTIYGPKDVKKRGGVVAFNVGQVHAHDVASILDEQGIAIRSGHHCAQPLVDFLGIKSAARASFYVYSTKEDVDRLVEGVLKVKEVFKVK